MRFAWGAYAMGYFPAMFPKGMSAKQFTEMLFDVLDLFASEHVVEDNGRPVGLIAAKGEDSFFEPHAQWFPWATSRQILAGSAKYLDKQRRAGRWGLIYVPADHRDFASHLCRYGLLRSVGQFMHHPQGQRYVFETVRRTD